MPIPHLGLYIGITVLVVAAVISLVLKKLAPQGSSLAKPWPLEPKPRILSERERALYQRLVQALPDHIVLAQVQLLQVLQFQRGRRTQALLNRFSQLSLDFLVVDRDSRPMLAIELDDATHDRPDRRRADARKNHALKSAGLPLVRWTAKTLPDAEAIRAAITTGGSGDGV